MLIRFTVANFMSFKEKTEFNFLTAEEVKTHDNHVFKAENGLELTRFAALYGANGSGKSNLVKAIKRFWEIVVFSNNNPHHPYFRLAEGYREKPAFFEIECYLDGSFWVYGIETEYETITKEWLYETFPFDNQKKDHRIYTVSNGEINWNDEYKERAEKLPFYQISYPNHNIRSTQGTILDRLFGLFNSYGRMITDSKTISLYKFISGWVIMFPKTQPESMVYHLDNNLFMKDWVEQLLTKTGIKQLKIKDTQPVELFGLTWEDELYKLTHRMDESEVKDLEGMIVPAYAQNVDGNIHLKRLVTVHQPDGQDGEFEFELYQESDGTKRILELAMETYRLVDAEANNHVPRLLIIDEIENSLHVHLIRHMLYALSRSTELKGQLLFTTHDTHLLDPRLFRPDEIWFAKKNGAEATELYPMSDFKNLDKIDWEDEYLSGYFGGIPKPLAFI